MEAKMKEASQLFCSSGKSFMEKYFSTDIEGDSHPALDMLKRLCTATKSLSVQVNQSTCLFYHKKINKKL